MASVLIGSQAENYIGLGQRTQHRDRYLGEEDSSRKKSMAQKPADEPLITLSGGGQLHLGAHSKVRVGGAVYVAKGGKLAVHQKAELLAAEDKR